MEDSAENTKNTDQEQERFRYLEKELYHLPDHVKYVDQHGDHWEIFEDFFALYEKEWYGGNYCKSGKDYCADMINLADLIRLQCEVLIISDENDSKWVGVTEAGENGKYHAYEGNLNIMFITQVYFSKDAGEVNRLLYEHAIAHKNAIMEEANRQEWEDRKPYIRDKIGETYTLLQELSSAVHGKNKEIIRGHYEIDNFTIHLK